MRLEDRESGAQDQFDREDEAERRRIMREASNAFAAHAQYEAGVGAPRRLTTLSAQRKVEVMLAGAVVAAFGATVVYATVTLGGAK